MPLISDMLPGFLGKVFWVSPQDVESLLIWILKMLNEKGPLPPPTPPKENPRIISCEKLENFKGFKTIQNTQQMESDTGSEWQTFLSVSAQRSW